MSAQIFLYTDAASIDEASLQMLRENGFIPIKVADESAVRLLPLPGLALAPEQMDAITSAALSSIGASGTAQAEFGKILPQLLLKRAKAA